MIEKHNTDTQLISKGEYKHYQIENFISVKQYMFLRSNGKKCIALRYINNLEHKVNGFKFLLIQIDANGNVIAKKKIKINNIGFYKNAEYTCNKGIVVDEKCVDFKVQMLCVYSDRYRYKVKNDKIAIYYVSHKNWAHEAEVERPNELKVRTKTKVKPISIGFIAIAVIIALVILVLSPIITYFVNKILGNSTKSDSKANKEEATSVAKIETSSVLEKVSYKE